MNFQCNLVKGDVNGGVGDVNHSASAESLKVKWQNRVASSL